MRFKYIVLLNIFLISLTFAADDIMNKFLYKLKHMSIVKIDFEQRFYPVGYTTPITSYGDAYIENKPPFKIKITYKKPHQFVILYDGKNTILYNKNSAYTSKGKNEEVKGLSVLNKHIEDAFRPILTSYQNGYYEVLFIPKAKPFKDIDYVILKLDKTLTPKSFYVYMPNKGVLYIKVLGFYGEKLNERIFKLN
ncbi:LolA family protein [Hydrogenobaculum acidophilum]